MAKMTMVQAINLALHQEMEKDETVISMGEDVGKDGGVFRVTDGLYEKFGDSRVIDTPLAESGILGTAFGMSLTGLRPVAEMQFCGFSYLMFPQLETNVARIRSRTHGKWTAPLVIRVPYGGGVRAIEHHSEAPEATYAHVPGVKVVVPSSPRNARALLVSAIRDPDPVIFLEPKRSYRAFKEDVPETEETMEIGKSNLLLEGKDITIVTWGAMTHVVEKAIKSIPEVSVELIDLLTLSPLDSDLIIDSIKKTGRCVVVQEGQRSYGISSEIIARINEDALLYLEAPVKRVSGFDVVTPYFARENSYIPDSKCITDSIKGVLEF